MIDRVAVLLDDMPNRKLLRPVEVAIFLGIRQDNISLVRHGTYGKCEAEQISKSAA